MGSIILGMLLCFAAVVYVVHDNAIEERDKAWRNHITAQNIKYHNDMMLKDGKVRRREEEIYDQLEKQRLLLIEKAKLEDQLAISVPLSEACIACRVPSGRIELPSVQPPTAPVSRPGSPANSGKGRTAPKPKRGDLYKMPGTKARAYSGGANLSLAVSPGSCYACGRD